LGIGIAELKRRYIALKGEEEEAQKRHAGSILERMNPREKNLLNLQHVKLFEFLGEIEEIFGKDKFPLLVPTAVNVVECTRKPMMKWSTLSYNSMSGDVKEETEWMQKLTQAVCGKGGAVQIRLGIDSHNICVLDVDHDDLVDPLLQANPILSTTLQTFGSKGRTFWFFAKGGSPQEAEDFPRGARGRKPPENRTTDREKPLHFLGHHSGLYDLHPKFNCQLTG
jgi:hypothetical protein